MNEVLPYKKETLLYLLILITGAAYYFLCYHTRRADSLQVFGLFTFLFISYYFLNKSFASHFKQLVIAGILFRVIILFSIPNLSDDVYRFIWDGRLLANRINPYNHLPTEVIQLPPIPGITKGLYQQLNSRSYYTIYPPVLQSIFWLTAKVFPTNIFGAIVCMKTFILFAETGTFYYCLWF